MLLFYNYELKKKKTLLPHYGWQAKGTEAQL